MSEILDIDICNSMRHDQFEDDYLYGETINSASERFLTMDAESFDGPMSMQAKFLLCYVMRLTKTGWKMHLNDLCEKLGVNRKSIYKYLKELIENGYCVRFQFKDEKNQFLKSKYRFFDLARTVKNLSTENHKEKNEPRPKFRDTVENIEKFPNDSRVPNFGIPDFGIPKNGTHINNNNIKNNNIKNNIIKKQQQLNETPLSGSLNHEKFSAAAVINISGIKIPEEDLVIRKELSKVQKSCIKAIISYASPDEFEYEKLQEEIEFVMPDLTQFTDAGDGFIRKLDTIKNMLLSPRKWTTPVGLLKKKMCAENKKYTQDRLEKQKIESEISCLRNLRDFEKDEDRIAHFNEQLKNLQVKKQSLLESLHEMH